MQFLGNPLWQFVANAAIGLLTIIVSVIIYRKQQNRKGITCEVISNTSMLSFRNEVKGRVQILFDKKPIAYARLVILKIWNSGNLAIEPDQYSDPIKVHFGEKAEILDAEVLDTVPTNMKDNVKASLKADTEGLILQPFLLNSGDSFTLKVLVAHPERTKEININVRIAGINKIVNYNRNTFYRGSYARLIIYISYLIYLISAIYFLFSIYEHNFIIKIYLLLAILFSALAYICLCVILISFFYSWTYKLSLFYSVKNTMTPLINLIRSLLGNRN